MVFGWKKRKKETKYEPTRVFKRADFASSVKKIMGESRAKKGRNFHEESRTIPQGFHLGDASRGSRERRVEAS